MTCDNTTGDYRWIRPATEHIAPGIVRKPDRIGHTAVMLSLVPCPLFGRPRLMLAAAFLGAAVVGLAACGSSGSEAGIWVVNRCAIDVTVNVASPSQAAGDPKVVPAGDDAFLRNVDSDAGRIFLTIEYPGLDRSTFTSELELSTLQQMPAAQTSDREDFQVFVRGEQCP